MVDAIMIQWVADQFLTNRMKGHYTLGRRPILDESEKAFYPISQELACDPLYHDGIHHPSFSWHIFVSIYAIFRTNLQKLQGDAGNDDFEAL